MGEEGTELLSRLSRFRLSGIFFVTYLAASALVPYLALYFAERGFSGVEIGVLLGVSPLLSLVATPIWTSIADARHLHRAILFVGVAALIVIHALIPWIGAYVLMLVAFILLAFFSSPVATLQDSAVLHMLGKQRDEYGQFRMWGTIGWGIGAIVFGVVLDKVGLTWMFWIYAGLMLVNLLLVQGLLFDHGKRDSTVLTGIKLLLCTPRWLVVFFIIFIAATGLTVNSNYLSLLIRQVTEANPLVFGFDLSLSTIVGIVLLTSILFEIPVMFFSKRLLARFGSRGLLLISLASIFLRNALYAVAPDPGQIVLIQLLHGFTFATMWMAGVDFVAQNAPPGLHATAQGLLNTATFGLGFAVGNFVSGALLDWVGIAGVFMASALVVLAGFFLLLVLDKRYAVFRPAPLQEI
jgi:MFS family permease